MRHFAPALVALGGVVACFGSLALLTLGPGLLADARTPNLTGQGVSVWIVDRFVAPGDTMRLEVEAHGGSATGIEIVTVRRDGAVVAQAGGTGRDWGNTITSRGRGADTVEVGVPIPSDARPGEPITLSVEVASIAAMARGAGSFSNERFHDVLPLVAIPRVGAGALLARALEAFQALAVLALWTLFVVVGAHVAQTQDGVGGARNADAAIGGVVGVGIAGTLIGYWLFARPFAAALGAPRGLDCALVDYALVDYALVGAWLALPLWIAWRRAKGHVPMHRYTLHVTAAPVRDGYRAREEAHPVVALDAAAEALAAAGWTLARRRPGRIRATRDTSRLDLRGSDLVTAPSDLAIHATDPSAPLHVAKKLAEAFGPLRVHGPALDVVVARDADVDAILSEQLRRTIELARAIVSRRL